MRGALRFRSERYSHDALNTFLKIELPAAQDAEPQPGEYQTIDQFYSAIADGIDRLCDALGEGDVFIGDEERQLRPVDYYGSGRLICTKNWLAVEMAKAHRI